MGTLFDHEPAPFTMPFGKHRGVPITRVPRDYLLWLANEPGMKNNIKRHAGRELLRRAEEARAQAARLSELPEGEPVVIFGVPLSAVESGLLDGAIKAGELVVGPDMPLSSPVPMAWKLWCEWHCIEHAVREINFDEDAP